MTMVLEMITCSHFDLVLLDLDQNFLAVEWFLRGYLCCADENFVTVYCVLVTSNVMII
jgi:hypothetical protein